MDDFAVYEPDELQVTALIETDPLVAALVRLGGRVKRITRRQTELSTQSDKQEIHPEEKGLAA